MSNLIQWLVVVLLMAWSLSFTLRRFLPAVLQQALATAAEARGWSRLAVRLQPVAKAGCDSGCSSCSPSCSSQATPAVAAQVVQWRAPPSSGSCH
ncbi:MAG: DUF6587 family protein [Moraxellaceae bacterium]